MRVTVVSNYGQFVVSGVAGDIAELRLPPDDDLVFGGDGALSVRTGSYSAPVQVTIERRDEAPSATPDGWEDAVELSALSPGGIVIAELMGDPVASVPLADGWHRLRISAKGRDEGEAQGEVGRHARSIESYLVQAWPAPPGDGVTLQATTLRPVDHTAGRPYLEPARAAAQLVNRSLTELASGRSGLSGDVASARVSWVYSAPARRLFNRVPLIHHWTSASASGTNKVATDEGYALHDNGFRDIWDGIPTGVEPLVHVDATFTEVERFKRVTTRWDWMQGYQGHEAKRLLPQSTTVVLEFEEETTPDGTKRTTVRLEHRDLPVEWVDAMRAVWLCKFEAGATVYRLTE